VGETVDTAHEVLHQPAQHKHPVELALKAHVLPLPKTFTVAAGLFALGHGKNVAKGMSNQRHDHVGSVGNVLRLVVEQHAHVICVSNCRQSLLVVQDFLGDLSEVNGYITH
jgi:hypothetical protein